MNRIKPEAQATIIRMAVEGCSIRSIERMTGAHRDTIMRHIVRVGEHCRSLLDERMRGLTIESLQADEIWCFVGKKQKRVSPDDPCEFGDTYTFVGMDADTKLVPWFEIDKRDEPTTSEFVAELAERIDGRVQITTDGWGAYRTTIPRHFGPRADFEQIIKVYAESPDEHRYSPAKVTRIQNHWVQGRPRSDRVSTSFIERQNLTIRMSMRRFTRLTNAFSKKLANLRAAVAMHFAWYNFVRIHSTLRITPAMAARITGSVWGIERLLPEW